MKKPHELLGVPRDATLLEIKRAYARVLKLNRPDDDPDAFGLVHAAFEACVANFRRRESEIEDEDDDEESQDDEFETEGQVVRWEADEGGWDSAAPSPVMRPATAVDDEVSRAVEAIVENAEKLPTKQFDSWLKADERLYALGFKRDVGDLAIERVSQDAARFPWQTLEAIHSFFEVDSIADPRLRNDFMARETWLRVQADARFHRRVEALRRNPYNTFSERVVLAELFDSPDRRRRLKMHLYPTLPGQLRNTFQSLSAEDPDRAEAALSTQARDYWLPLTDPAKLHWRRLALAVGHAATLALLFAALVTAFEFSARLFFNVWGVITAILFGIWLARVLFSFGTARYSAWRLRTVGAGEAPAGANLFADRITVIAGGAAALSLTLSAVVLHTVSATTGIFFQMWLVIFMIVPAIRGTRFRWETALAVLAVASAAYPLLAKLGSLEGIDDFLAAAPGALAIGILCVLVLDDIHGRVTRQPVADVRDAISVPQCVLAIVAIAIALFLA